MTDDTDSPQGDVEELAITAPTTAETDDGPRKIEDNTADAADPDEDGAEGDESEEDKASKAKERRDRARRARERLIAENATLKERLRAGESPRQTETAKPDGPPKEADFSDFFEYQRALARYEIKQEMLPEIEKAKSSASQIREQERYESIAKSHQTRVEAFSKVTPDFQEVLQDSESDLEPGTPAYKTAQKIIVESDIGPQILYYLAKNPDVTDRLGRMDEVSVARELGKLEAKLTPPKGRTSTSAPPPIRTVKGGANLGTKDPSKMSMSEYVAYRSAKK